MAAQGGAPVLVARSTRPPSSALAGELGGPAAVVAGDVGRLRTSPSARPSPARASGGLWGLVNNAGINPYYHPS